MLLVLPLHGNCIGGRMGRWRRESTACLPATGPKNCGNRRRRKMLTFHRKKTVVLREQRNQTSRSQRLIQPVRLNHRSRRHLGSSDFHLSLSLCSRVSRRRRHQRQRKHSGILTLYPKFKRYEYPLLFPLEV